MVSGLYYAIAGGKNGEIGSVSFTIKRKHKRVPTPWRYERYWEVTNQSPSRMQYPTLKKAIKAIESLNIKFNNYPGPNKVLSE